MCFHCFERIQSNCAILRSPKSRSERNVSSELEVSWLADVHCDFAVELVFLYIYHVVSEWSDAIRVYCLSCVSDSLKSMKQRYNFRRAFSLSCIYARVFVKDRLPLWVWLIFLVSWVTNHSTFTNVSTRPWYFHTSKWQPSKIITVIKTYMIWRNL